MTRSQLELLKKGTYFFLVLTLGGSVMWLSSGGTMFRSDLVNANIGTDITPQSGLLNTLKSNANTAAVVPPQVVPAQVVPVNAQAAMSSNAVPVLNSNVAPATNTPPSNTNYEGFASLKSSATYTQEESSVVAQNYTEELSGNDVPMNENVENQTTTTTSNYAPQVLTQTKASTPESGPAELLFIAIAFGLSILFVQLKKHSS